MSEARIRVLMLATYFPKPLNQLMGNWALSQAEALQNSGIELTVASLTSWVPAAMAITPGARAYARCPKSFDWNGIVAHYPRWLHYAVGPQRRIDERNPRPGLEIGWFTAKHTLSQLVRSTRPDLVYAHHTAVNGFLATKLKRLYGLPFVVTDHDFDEIESCRLFPGRRSVFREVIDNSSAMVAVSQRMEREMHNQFPHGRTYAIPNGAKPVPRSLAANPRPQALLNKVIIFSCGTFYHRKGFPLLIDAFSRVAAKYPEAELRIAGNGEERGQVEARIRELGLESKVTLLGAQPHNTVIQEMVWCDIFALIGWDEPFATVYLEALSAGRPIICCSDGGITDVVKDGVHGFTIEPRDVVSAANALDRLLASSELRKSMGSAGLHLFKTSLTWEQHATRMTQLFEEAIRERTPVLA